MPIFTIPLLKDDVWDKEDINTTIDVGRGQLMIRVFQKNLIFEFDHGVEFEHTYGQYEQ